MDFCFYFCFCGLERLDFKVCGWFCGMINLNFKITIIIKLILSGIYDKEDKYICYVSISLRGCKIKLINLIFGLF